MLRRARCSTRAHRAGPRPRGRDRGGARARRDRRASPPTCSRSCCSPRRASWAPTSSSAPRSASACRWASAARTPASWRCAQGLERTLPGRLVGVSVDADGAPALPARAADPRAAHPPREGDRNICTAQVLLAVMAGMYAVYHGPRGPARDRPPRPPATPRCSPPGFAPRGVEVVHDAFFDTVTGARAGPAPRRSLPPRASAASTCGGSTPTPSAIACDEVTDAAAGRGGLGRVPGPRRRSTSSTRRRTTPLPGRAAAHARLPDPPGVPRSTAPRPRCCATCAGWPTGTSRWTAG